MDLVLSGIRWEDCLVEIDDIVIMGKTFKNHLQNLRKVQERLRGAGLRLKPAKCSLICEMSSFWDMSSRDMIFVPTLIKSTREEVECPDFYTKSATVSETRWILPSLHLGFLRDRDTPLPAD